MLPLRVIYPRFCEASIIARAPRVLVRKGCEISSGRETSIAGVRTATGVPGSHLQVHLLPPPPDRSQDKEGDPEGALM